MNVVIPASVPTIRPAVGLMNTDARTIVHKDKVKRYGSYLYGREEQL